MIIPEIEIKWKLEQKYCESCKKEHLIIGDKIYEKRLKDPT